MREEAENNVLSLPILRLLWQFIFLTLQSTVVTTRNAIECGSQARD